MTRIISNNVSEIIDELFSNSSAFDRVTKPVKYFFQKGRTIAELYLSEAIELYESEVMKLNDSEQYDLPQYVLQAFEKWKDNVSEKKEYKVRGLRLRGPWILFQPYGAGVSLCFPKQEIENIEIYDA